MPVLSDIRNPKHPRGGQVSTTEKSVALIAQKLGELRSYCDTGFALAVHIRYTRPTLLYQTYEQAWADQYSEKGYMMSDPTVHWGLANVGSMDWDKLEAHDPEGVIKAAKSHGLLNGWTYATGPANSRSLGSMTRSQPFTATQRSAICALIDAIHAETEDFDTFTPDVQERLRHLI
jgi:LuxR family transcriptional regulator, quorum-sensing system regulator SdiA